MQTQGLSVERTALVVVDVQNDFCHADGAIGRRGLDMSAMPAMAAANQRLIDACHRCAAPVFFVRTVHGRWTDSAVWRGRFRAPEQQVDRQPICLEGGWGAEFFALRPEDADRVVTKHRYSAFYGTDLELILRALDRSTLIVTGVATNVCVETTVRDAFMRDFDTIVVPEGCAALTPVEHDSGLRSIDTYFGRVLSLGRVIDALR